MSNGNGGGIPWPVWALVTLGAALISAYAALAGGGGDGNGGNPPPPPIDFSDRVGVYTGQSVNKTLDVRGAVTLDLKNIESPNGDVEAGIGWTQGLYGDGNLSGQVDENGVMRLSGDIYAPADVNRSSYYIYDGELDCQFASTSEIRCTYELLPRPGNPSGAQNGELSVTHAGA